MTAGAINTILISALISIVGVCFTLFIKALAKYKENSDLWKKEHSEKLDSVKEDVLENRVKVENIQYRLNRVEDSLTPPRKRK